MNNPPLNSRHLPIYPTHTDVGVANGHTCVVPADCGSNGGSNDGANGGLKRFAAFRQVSQVESCSILQDFPDDPVVQNQIFSHLSFADLLSVELVSRCFRYNTSLSHVKEIAFFRELPDNSRSQIEKWIRSSSDYLIDYLERFSTAKPEGYFRAMQQEKPKAFVEILYFNLRETIGKSGSFDTEFKAVMVHQNRVGTVQFSAGIPQILSSNNTEVKMMEFRGAQWVDTFSTRFDINHWSVLWGEYSAQLIANDTCLVTNNGHRVKIFERSGDGKWDHKISLFGNNDTEQKSTVYARPNSCNVFVSAYCHLNGRTAWLAKYSRNDSEGNRIALPIGVSNWVGVHDVTLDGRYALVSDNHNPLIYELADEGLEVVGSLSDCRVSHAIFSPDGTRIVTLDGFTARVFIRSNQIKCRQEYIIDHDGDDPHAFSKVSFSPDGTTIALSDTCRVEIYGRQGEGAWGRQAVLDDFGGGRIFSELIFSPDGTHVVITLADDNELKHEQRLIGKISDGRWVEKAEVAANGLVVFSPDQTHVAIYTGRDQQIALCELSDDLPKVTIIKHSQTVNSIQFSDDGSHVVTGSDDGLVRIWGQSGKIRWRQKAVIEHHEPVHLVQFVMKMTHILACCDNRLNIYELKPQGPSSEELSEISSPTTPALLQAAIRE
ncbi:hypothetical protein [Endozoicomonas sp. ONNA2]|uniref:F-box/WD repeat-containing protein n=1 Tax=Endozoicomonas sp. ONNA2 TaxID=2828741 RepID=UPI00214816EE|nr:hypothetical protein [Endozoicomonas sp. ONNA2]